MCQPLGWHYFVKRTGYLPFTLKQIYFVRLGDDYRLLLFAGKPFLIFPVTLPVFFKQLPDVVIDLVIH
jgi:hypothetical protein